MLLITAGFGHDSPSKVWLSFRANEFFDVDCFKEVAGNYGCEERFCDKAASVLTTSGRYDCCVQRTWVNSRFKQLRRDMITAGVRVLFDPSYSPPMGMTWDNIGSEALKRFPKILKELAI